jgi:hypothetical protein
MDVIRYISDNTAVIARHADQNKVEAIRKLRTMFRDDGTRRQEVADLFVPPSPMSLSGASMGLYEAKRLVEMAQAEVISRGMVR